jgi:t-SNARE complex subunit (syntaxin)
MSGRKKEELKPQTLEEEVEELKQKFGHIIQLCIPPKEVLDEIKKDFITAQVSLLKIFKTLLDYQIETLEKLAQGETLKGENKSSKGLKKIKVE